jgi:hypothetical protein
VSGTFAADGSGRERRKADTIVLAIEYREHSLHERGAEDKEVLCSMSRVQEEKQERTLPSTWALTADIPTIEQ